VGCGEDEAAAEHIEPFPLAIIFVDRDRGTDPLPDRRCGLATAIVEDVRRASTQMLFVSGSAGLFRGKTNECHRPTARPLRPPETRPRLQSAPRRNGDHLRMVRIRQMVRIGDPRTVANHYPWPVYLLDDPGFGHSWHAIFLGSSEWTIGTLLLLGFWNKKAGMLGALGSIATFIATLTVMPFVPDAWDAGAGGFPAMTNNSAFLLKDLVLLAVSIYLLKQDAQRVLNEETQRGGRTRQVTA
jgi:hypothetical protein